MSFNPETFLNATFTEANDTQMTPIPVGEYPARIGSVEFKSGISNKDGSPWLKLTVKWELEDYALAETLGRTPSTFQDIWMDITGSGSLDMGKGKNIGLGRLRDAVGLNVPGEPFSPSMFPGHAARVKIEQEPYKDRILSKVTAVAKLA